MVVPRHGSGQPWAIGSNGVAVLSQIPPAEYSDEPQGSSLVSRNSPGVLPLRAVFMRGNQHDLQRDADVLRVVDGNVYGVKSFLLEIQLLQV